MNADIAVYTSGEILTKSFSLVDGSLVKRPGGHMTSGQVERFAVACPEDLAGKVLNLTTHQALGFGLSAHNIARIVAQGMLDRIPQNASTPTIARTAQNIAFAKGKPGIMMLDVDPPKDGTPPLTREQAIPLVVSVCPEFARAPLVICDSASSHIWNSETGEQLIGARGLRIYIFVADASDIPRAGKVLVNKLWLAGHGHIEFSASGSLLERCPIDSAVWQAERLDFAAGAACEPPLEQRRPAPEARNNDAPPLDTRRALPPLTTKQEGELRQLVQAAKEKAKPEAARINAQWLERRVDAELARDGMTRETHPREAQAKRDQFAAVAATSILHDKFILYLKDGQAITVSEVLANREKYDGARCADPLDPGCYNDPRIGIIILGDGDARIFSHAHGGQVYYLGEAKKAEATQGKSAPACAAVVTTCAADIEMEAISWLWALWLACGKLHILAGEAGTGKTTIALWLASIVSCAGRWPDGSRAEAGSVLIWSGEDDPKDTLVPRLAAAGADLSRVHIISGVEAGEDVRTFDPAKDMEGLLDAAQRIGNVKMLILDPIVNAVSGDSHKNTEVRRGLQPVVDFGTRTGCAILGITHFSKGSVGRSPLERLVGSLAFGALARVVMVAATRENQDDAPTSRIFMRAKSNIGPDDGGYGYDLEQTPIPEKPEISASRVTWGQAIDGKARDVLNQAEAVKDSESSAIAEARAFLREALDEGKRSAAELKAEAQDAGIAWRTVERAKDGLVVVEKGGKAEGKKWFWRLENKDRQVTPPPSFNGGLGEVGEVTDKDRQGRQGRQEFGFGNIGGVTSPQIVEGIL
ncbi:MAG: AAA family ATPase [Desulfomicrobium sp.]|nr:AAA family ATPase [Desulfomicrobium sp.]